MLRKRDPATASGRSLARTLVSRNFFSRKRLHRSREPQRMQFPESAGRLRASNFSRGFRLHASTPPRVHHARQLLHARPMKTIRMCVCRYRVSSSANFSTDEVRFFYFFHSFIFFSPEGWFACLVATISAPRLGYFRPSCSTDVERRGENDTERRGPRPRPKGRERPSEGQVG